VDNIVTASRRRSGAAKKAERGDFSSEKRRTRAKRARGKYYLDAKNFQSSAFFRGKIFFARPARMTVDVRPRRGGRGPAPGRIRGK
jgi:hypothetical protein